MRCVRFDLRPTQIQLEKTDGFIIAATGHWELFHSSAILGRKKRAGRLTSAIGSGPVSKDQQMVICDSVAPYDERPDEALIRRYLAGALGDDDVTEPSG
jgi:hypothetical protein